MATILLVEDNEMNRDMLSRRLVRRGFDVIIAVDGEIGVSLAISELPDLILMDMSLPVLDGWEATKKIKALPLTESIPVIALTAHAMVGDREKTLAAGCDDYDTKPVDLKRLLKKIHALLATSSAQTSRETQPEKPVVSESVPPQEEAKASPSIDKAVQSKPIAHEQAEVIVPEASPISHQTTFETIESSKTRFNSDSIPLLVVDDILVNREVLGRRLKKAGYQILFAETGEEALQTIQNETVALILLDVMMPGIGGWETLKRIRAQYKASELPVIMVTAKDQSEDVVNAFSLGANDYITKPIDFPITLARIQSQLQLLDLSSRADMPAQKSRASTLNIVENSILSDNKLPPSIKAGEPSGPRISKVSVSELPIEDNKSTKDEEGVNPLNNRYQIFQELRSSPYHQNLLAYDMKQEQKVVAIQHFPGPENCKGESLKLLFQQELTYLAPVINRNSSQISRILDTYIQGDRLYVVQKHIDGNLLSQELDSGQPHSELYSMNVLGRLLEILSILHQNNIALQHFSSQSFTRRKLDGEICLTDLGLSQRIHAIFQPSTPLPLRDNTDILQHGQHHLDFSRDLYLVGRIAIQALTGIYPNDYHGENRYKRLDWDMSGDINHRCRNFVNRLIHPIKNLQFQSATEAYRNFIKNQLLFHVLKEQNKTTV